MRAKERRCCIKGCKRPAELVVTPISPDRDGNCRYYDICRACKQQFPNAAVLSVIPRRAPEEASAQ